MAVSLAVERIFGPGNFRTAADLGKLPVIERDQLQQDPAYFVSTAQPLAGPLSQVAQRGE
ncbi:MAG: hypothetical protein ACRERD_30535 [Candidatus Binatia bacterium]